MECCDHHGIAGFLWALLEQQSSTSQKGPADPRWEFMSGFPRSPRLQLQPEFCSLPPQSGLMLRLEGAQLIPRGFGVLSLSDAHPTDAGPLSLLKTASAAGQHSLELRRKQESGEERGNPPTSPLWHNGRLLHVSSVPLQAERHRVLCLRWTQWKGKEKTCQCLCSLAAWYPATIVPGFASCARTWWEWHFKISSERGWIWLQDILFSYLNWNLLTGESIYTAGRFLCAKDQVKINVIRNRGKPGQSI